jgi:peptidoglycan/LPS O-acetylase OafA/YrhL
MNIFIDQKSKGEFLFEKWFAAVVWISAVIGLIVLGIFEKLDAPYILEVLLGIVFGVPSLQFLKNISIRSKVDGFLGDISYGIFLSHFLVIWMYDTYIKDVAQIQNKHLSALIILIITIVLAVIGHVLIERPIKGIRRKVQAIAIARRTQLLSKQNTLVGPERSISISRS